LATNLLKKCQNNNGKQMKENYGPLILKKLVWNCCSKINVFLMSLCSSPNDHWWSSPKGSNILIDNNCTKNVDYFQTSFYILDNFSQILQKKKVQKKTLQKSS